VFFVSFASFSCSEEITTDSQMTKAKASSMLLQQIALRREQLSTPTDERLAQMKLMGMRIENIAIQRIYILLNHELDPSQADELRSLGVALYSDSWIPPVSGHPTGFMLADMPVDEYEAIATKEYVISLDTAETKLEPRIQ
jgi:hypothetical protein